MPTIKPDWYCIVNPHAGSGKTMPEWAVAERYLTSMKVPYKTTLTNYKFHATLLAYEAACHGYRRILAVGGDGSVHEVFNGIMKYVDEFGVSPEDFFLAVIPIGSGNDWIKSSGVPHDTKEVVRLISESSFAKEDVIRVETSDGINYMANIGGVGFDSHVCERVNGQKENGKRSSRIYLSALLYTVFHIRKFNTVVSADGKIVFDGAAYSIALGNGRFSGGGMLQVPEAVMDDGLLDYMIVPRISILKILTLLPRLYKGNINETGIVVSGQCREMLVTGSDIVELDGEIKGCLPMRLSATGRQINVLAGRKRG